MIEIADAKKQCIGTLTLSLAVACAGPTPPPEPMEFTMEEVAGAYAVTSFEAFEIQDPSNTTDLLNAGAELEITLTADGRTSGQLFIPCDARPIDEDAEEDLNVDLAGSWRILETDPIVVFRFEADTFLEALDWGIADRDRPTMTLFADEGVPSTGVGFEATLARQ